MRRLAMAHPAIAEARPYPGLTAVLERVRGLLEGSYLWADGAARMLQDPLSFRSAVQVHGAARDALAFARGQLEIELNAAQENPLLEGLLIYVAQLLPNNPPGLDVRRVDTCDACRMELRRAVLAVHYGIAEL